MSIISRTIELFGSLGQYSTNETISCQAKKFSVDILVTVLINATPPPTSRPNLEMLSSKPLDTREVISFKFIVALQEDEESFDGKMIYSPSWGRVVSASGIAFNRDDKSMDCNCEGNSPTRYYAWCVCHGSYCSQNSTSTYYSSH